MRNGPTSNGRTDEQGAYEEFKALLGSRVGCNRFAFGAHTGHHHTPVLPRVNSLDHPHWSAAAASCGGRWVRENEIIERDPDQSCGSDLHVMRPATRSGKRHGTCPLLL